MGLFSRKSKVAPKPSKPSGNGNPVLKKMPWARSGTPSEGDVAAYLKLAHVFRKLELSIRQYADEGKMHGIIEIAEDPETKAEFPLEYGQTYGDYSWYVYLLRASERFTEWWRYLANNYAETFIPDDQVERVWTEKLRPIENFLLPPLDVLLVWYAFMQHPKHYLTDCIRAKNRRLWRMDFPWWQVAEFIVTGDDKELSYNPDQAHQEAWTKETGIIWDNLSDKDLKGRRRCYHCDSEVDIPISKPISFNENVWSEVRSENDFLAKREKLIGDEHVLANPFCMISCHSCGREIDSSHFCLARLKSDVRNLMAKPVKNDSFVQNLFVLKGGYLSFNTGNVESNRRLNGPFSRISELLTNLIDSDCHYSEQVIRDIIMNKFHEMYNYGGSMRDIKKPTGSPEARRIGMHARGMKQTFGGSEVEAVQTVLSYYINDLNSSEFSLSLPVAAFRTTLFQEMLNVQNLLDGDDLKSVLKSSLTRYDQYMKLKLFVTDPLVSHSPTFDIELAWNTHLSSPGYYYDYCFGNHGGFVNKDDRIEFQRLDATFNSTADIFEATYNEPFNVCTCGYCTKNCSSILGDAYRDGEKVAWRASLPSGRSFMTHVSGANAIYIPDFHESKAERSFSAPEKDKRYAQLAYPWWPVYFSPPINFFPSLDSTGNLCKSSEELYDKKLEQDISLLNLTNNSSKTSVGTGRSSQEKLEKPRSIAPQRSNSPKLPPSRGSTPPIKAEKFISTKTEKPPAVKSKSSTVKASAGAQAALAAAARVSAPKQQQPRPVRKVKPSIDLDQWKDF